MTKEEIEKIETAINFVDYCTPAETNEDVELAGIAIEALEKQIPKEVIKTVSTVRCSNCNKQLTNKGSLHGDYKFCKWCGQAIDWSENNE